MNIIFWILRCLQFRFLQPFYFNVHKVVLALMNYGVGGDDNGEETILKLVARYNKVREEPLTIFDVGGNVGQYTQLIDKHLPDNKIIHTFEPAKKSFEQLKHNTAHILNVHYHHTGLSDSKTSMELYSDANGNCDIDSSCASLYASNITDYLSENLHQETIQLDTLDHICAEHKIEHIDFLKIDVEGNEFAVLKGAKKTLAAGKIDMIQFEHNRCAISAHTFFKDYWDLLSEHYAFYRPLANNHGLYPIKQYDPYLENFTYINYIAIRKGSALHALAA